MTVDPHTEGVLTRHGLGKPKVRCFAGETFEASESRLFREAQVRFDLAMTSARAAMEDAGLDPDALKDFDAMSHDVGAHWRADKRAEE